MSGARPVNAERRPAEVVHPARPGARRFTPDELWAIPRVGRPAPIPGGPAVVVPVTTYDVEANEGRSRLWQVPLDGGAPRPLTPADRSSTQPTVSPDGRRLAFLRKDERGQAQVHLLSLGGGEAERVTDLPRGVADVGWLPDGSGLVLAASLLAGHLTPDATRAELARREKDPVKAHVTEARVFRFWDTWLTTGEVSHLFVLGLGPEGPGALRDLTPDALVWLDWMEPAGQLDVSPDGREVAYAAIVFDEARSLLYSAAFTLPLAGGPVRRLEPDHAADILRPRYSPDGRWLVYGRREDPLFYADRVRLWRVDRATGARAPWLADWTLSPDDWAFGPDGALWFRAEEKARASLFALDAGHPRAPAAEPRRVHRGGTIGPPVPAPDGSVLFTRHTLVDPPEAWRAPADGGPPARLTRFTEAAMAGLATGQVTERWIEGAGGETVQLWVVEPPDAPPGPPPLVQLIHGGPHGSSGDEFHFRWNPHVLAAPGYLLALVNFQGSTSFGQDFARRIQGAWGDRPYEDVMRATDLLVREGAVDPARLAAAGGSYGGYLVSWIAGHTDRFRCLVNLRAGAAPSAGSRGRTWPAWTAGTPPATRTPSGAPCWCSTGSAISASRPPWASSATGS